MEQLAFCRAHHTEAATTQLAEAGFSYVRSDNIQAGIKAAGFNMSMWVYNGTDIVSQNIQRAGIWEQHETAEILRKLAFFEQVGKQGNWEGVPGSSKRNSKQLHSGHLQRALVHFIPCCRLKT